jgi:hypothetical protein
MIIAIFKNNELNNEAFSHSSISRAHMMHERFFGHNSSALSSILRNTVNRIGSSYIVHGSGGRGSDAWRHR